LQDSFQAHPQVFLTEGLERLPKTSLNLQNPEIDLNEGVRLLQSLEAYISDLRTNDSFEDFEQEGIAKAGTSVYKEETQRKRKVSTRITRYDGEAHATDFSPRQSFKINVYLPILDKLPAELKKHTEAYRSVSNRFGFLSHICNIDVDALKKAANTVIQVYPDNFDLAFVEELVHFQKYIQGQSDDDVTGMYGALARDRLHEVYPNTYICFKIYMFLMITNFLGERSFSALKRLKTYLHSTMNDEKLSHLALMHIESDMLRSVDLHAVIDTFVNQRIRTFLKLQM
ncbi:uncharacterized protein LOC106474896, partial [Limulus polyphemus]|uniref:Uncharacterized protein LOC106474896 n=1 Tax=Limulus polyphemus TaxID=6850 RepID=A0ABM1BYE9_LIMPO